MGTETKLKMYDISDPLVDAEIDLKKKKKLIKECGLKLSSELFYESFETTNETIEKVQKMKQDITQYLRSSTSAIKRTKTNMNIKNQIKISTFLIIWVVILIHTKILLLIERN